MPIDEDLEWLFDKIKIGLFPIKEIAEEDFAKPQDERYLDLRVDLTEDEETLKKAFTDILERHKPHTRSTRLRGTTYDKWQIWDLHHLSNLSFLEIARQKSGKNYKRGQEKNPAYNPELWPPYKRVQKAYGQAVKIIAIVEDMILHPQKLRLERPVVSISPMERSRKHKDDKD